jgi:hypothetical protein
VVNAAGRGEAQREIAERKVGVDASGNTLQPAQPAGDNGSPGPRRRDVAKDDIRPVDEVIEARDIGFAAKMDIRILSEEIAPYLAREIDNTQNIHQVLASATV